MKQPDINNWDGDFTHFLMGPDDDQTHEWSYGEPVVRVDDRIYTMDDMLKRNPYSSMTVDVKGNVLDSYGHVMVGYWLRDGR